MMWLSPPLVMICLGPSMGAYFGIHMYTDRMPVFIGSFLSRSVYGGQLKSHHSIAGHDCLAFSMKQAE